MIRLSFDAVDPLDPKAGPAGLLVCEDEGLLHPALKPRQKKLLELAKEENFTGKAGQVASVALEGRRLLLAGLGKRKAAGLEELRQAAARLARAAQPRYKALGLALPALPGKTPEDCALAVAEGLLLASYRYTRYKAPKKGEDPVLEKASLLGAARDRAAALRALRKAELRCASVAYVRDLVNDGPSDKKPEQMAAHARALSGGPVRVKVFGKKELARMGMNAILGVARGSDVEPKLVHLAYKPKGRPRRKVALVGKGITFDSGGLSIKPAQSMETMKMDMAGGAAVLGVFKALKELRPPVEVHGFAPFTYNLPGGDALKPGDILKAYNGKTIEVLNTDAEGRLVLSDTLAYASEQKFDAIVDLATLTGAALIALGSKVTAAMASDAKLLAALREAGERSGEKIWELPLVPEYKPQIRSKVADLQNIGSVRGEAGTIIGGLFLQEFVDSSPWVHLDIAGPAWAGQPGPTEAPGGTGVMVRTLLEWLESL